MYNLLVDAESIFCISVILMISMLLPDAFNSFCLSDALSSEDGSASACGTADRSGCEFPPEQASTKTLNPNKMANCIVRKLNSLKPVLIFIVFLIAGFICLRRFSSII